MSKPWKSLFGMREMKEELLEGLSTAIQNIESIGF